jgi:hypothetical protein
MREVLLGKIASPWKQPRKEPAQNCARDLGRFHGIDEQKLNRTAMPLRVSQVLFVHNNAVSPFLRPLEKLSQETFARAETAFYLPALGPEFEIFVPGEKVVGMDGGLARPGI